MPHGNDQDSFLSLRCPDTSDKGEWPLLCPINRLFLFSIRLTIVRTHAVRSAATKPHVILGKSPRPFRASAQHRRTAFAGRGGAAGASCVWGHYEPGGQSCRWTHRPGTLSHTRL